MGKRWDEGTQSERTERSQRSGQFRCGLPQGDGSIHLDKIYLDLDLHQLASFTACQCFKPNCIRTNQLVVSDCQCLKPNCICTNASCQCLLVSQTKLYLHQLPIGSLLLVIASASNQTVSAPTSQLLALASASTQTVSAPTSQYLFSACQCLKPNTKTDVVIMPVLQYANTYMYCNIVNTQVVSWSSAISPCSHLPHPQQSLLPSTTIIIISIKYNSISINI